MEGVNLDRWQVALRFFGYAFGLGTVGIVLGFGLVMLGAPPWTAKVIFAALPLAATKVFADAVDRGKMWVVVFTILVLYLISFQYWRSIG